MNEHPSCSGNGFTLTEMLVATLILFMASLGSLALFATPPEYRIAKDFAAIQYGYAMLEDALMQHLDSPGSFLETINLAYNADNAIIIPTLNTNRLSFFTGNATYYYRLRYKNSPPNFTLTLYRSTKDVPFHEITVPP